MGALPPNPRTDRSSISACCTADIEPLAKKKKAVANLFIDGLGRRSYAVAFPSPFRVVMLRQSCQTAVAVCTRWGSVGGIGVRAYFVALTLRMGGLHALPPLRLCFAASAPPSYLGFVILFFTHRGGRSEILEHADLGLSHSPASADCDCSPLPPAPPPFRGRGAEKNTGYPQFFLEHFFFNVKFIL
jgi:hypothetical protein